jgi:outer membrane receptor protein involved in Fe transport
MTRAVTLLLLTCTVAFTASAQPANGNTAMDTNTGIFYGKIVDADTQKGLEGVTIQLLQNKIDSVTGKKKELILATQLSDKKGEFSLDQLPLTGPFKLRVSYVGYKPFDTKVNFDQQAIKDGDLPYATIKDLGNYRLFADPTQLNDISINANKPLLQMYLDKKVYNVEKDLSAAGGTALDVLKNIPGVLVDLEGNVIIRNASPQVFIDGRPSPLTLEQIPSDQIASVEIMTNPSARYDASGGGAGILNIVLKKSRPSGYNGNVRAGIDSRGRPSAGFDINIKQNKINFFAATQLSMRKSISGTSTYRKDYPGNDITAITTQKSRPVNKGYFGFGRAGFDWLATNRTTFTLSGNYMQGKIKVADLLNIVKDSIKLSGTLSESSIRNLKADIYFENTGASLGVKHNFAEAGKEWTADINFNRNENTNTSDYSSRSFDMYGNEKPYTGAERAMGGGGTKFYTAQTDFINPITKNTKFETGLRVAMRDYSSWNDNFRQSPPSVLYLPLPATTVQFDFKDIVYAAYGIYSQTIRKFSYQFGLRLESSEYKGNLVNKNLSFSNKYPVSLFPSVNLSQQLNDRLDLQLSYSRKINRPGFFQILPFVDFSDSLNLSVGNPGLKPEFTHLAELSFNSHFSSYHSVMATLYGKYSNDLITRYQYKGPNTDPSKTDSVIYNSYANADKSYTAGLEITAKNQLAKFWEVTSNINFFNVVLKADNITGTGNEERFSWFAKMNNSFKLPAKFSLQVTAEYQASTLLPVNSGRNSANGFGGGMYGFTQNLAQGYIKPIYGMDISLRKEFFKDNRASVTLQVNDIFRTRAYETYTETSFFVQDNYRLRDPQVFRLNFNWRFGKSDAALSRRKNNRNDGESLQIQQGSSQ